MLAVTPKGTKLLEVITLLILFMERIHEITAGEVYDRESDSDDDDETTTKNDVISGNLADVSITYEYPIPFVGGLERNNMKIRTDFVTNSSSVSTAEIVIDNPLLLEILQRYKN